MASVNKVILVGNLRRDPEVRYLPSGDAVANVTIATSSKYKGKDGNMVEETEWHRVTFFGKLAEIVGQYLKKGRSIYVEGRIKTRKYTDKDGVEKCKCSVAAKARASPQAPVKMMATVAAAIPARRPRHALRLPPQSSARHLHSPRRRVVLTTWMTTFRSRPDL